MSEPTQLCTFSVGNLFIGVDVRNVQEVLRYQKMTRVPMAPKMVSGLINLRGEIVTAVDLRCCFGLESRPAGELPMNVVILGDEGAVSLLVDSIGNVYSVGDESLDTLPETLTGPVRSLTKGVYKMDEQLLLLLDTELVLKVTDGSRDKVA